jgi:class 3 adenylate cyclase
MKNKNDSNDTIKDNQVSSRMRMDIVSEIISFDKKTGIVKLISMPDPRRYEWVEREGKDYLYDKFDKVYFPKEFFVDIVKFITEKLPAPFQSPMIENADKYVESRSPFIKKMLAGISIYPSTFEDKSEDFLQSLSKDKLGFVILSLDIVGSTKLSTNIDPKLYSRLISTILFELSEIIPKFHGHVLKYTGDGIIAYFPEPSFIIKNDLAIDCALTLRKLIYKTLNPILGEQGFFPIGIRIGLDAGEAYIETIGSPETKQQKDIIGAVVSLAAKIQARAKPGEIYVGDTVLRNLHTIWRQICEPVNLGSNWDYKYHNGNIYKVHKVNIL